MQFSGDVHGKCRRSRPGVDNRATGVDSVRRSRQRINRCMSVMELKAQAAGLPIEEQAELAEFLAERLRRNDPDYRRVLAGLRDDPDPAHWVSWSQVKEQDGN